LVINATKHMGSMNWGTFSKG